MQWQHDVEQQYCNICYFNSLDWDSFERMCLVILKQCTSKDLNEMKWWLQLEDVIPETKLENVETPHQLFLLMVEAKLLSIEKLYYLDKTLSSAGRQDLRRQLEGELKILLNSFVFSNTLQLVFFTCILTKKWVKLSTKKCTKKLKMH